jgi:nicotinate-nucleotide adenylyltransferase
VTSVGPEPSARTVAFFGGSFNPPHVAHVLAVTYALAVHPVDEVLVAPVYLHPFSKELAPFEDRAAMCRLAMGWIPGVTVTEIERELGGESRTLRTLENLAAAHPDWRLRLLVGADVLADAPKWHRFDRIAALAPPLVLGRVGAASEGAPEPMLPRVSSTEVRAAIGAGDVGAVRHLVPRRVLAYATEHGLYSGGVGT